MTDFKCSTCGDELTAEQRFLHDNGWDHWYSSAWVRPDTVSDPTRQDYTGYQFKTADAINFTKNPKPAPYVGDLGAALKYIAESSRRNKAVKDGEENKL